jgi:uncharacterized protein YyaL (SSP411 family)
MPHATTPDGVKLYYEEAGGGTPILFVHEYSGDWRSWEPQMRFFARRHRCITYSFRGYPGSDVPESGSMYGQQQAVDDARHMLDHLKIDKAHIVGLSQGAFATAHFGRLYADRALSLTLAGCGTGAHPAVYAQFQEEARALADTIVGRFADPERGGFFSTADDHEALIARRKDLEDAPIPAGGSSAALGLLRLAALTGEHAYEERAAGQLALLHEIAVQHPTAFGHVLQALDLYLAPRREVALAGDAAGVAALAAVVREERRPHLVLAAGPGDGDTHVPLLRDRVPVDGRAAAYVCERFACQRPVTEPDELRAALRGPAGSGPAPTA